jgi:AcrR family transcriptional regulator
VKPDRTLKGWTDKDRTPKDRSARDRTEKDLVEKDRTRRPSGRTRAKTDRRILRTRNTLGEAIVALMQERTFEEITVQEVLDRAGVGRSTFYTHYRDKNDLFMSDVEDFLEAVASGLKSHQASSKRLLPVREFLSHVRDVRTFYAALTKSDKMNDLLALARGIFARSIEERLQSAGVKIAPAQRVVQAYALAGSFLSLLEWWAAKGMKTDPSEMDEIFHRMAWNGLSGK